jgi:hypothetical protein
MIAAETSPAGGARIRIRLQAGEAGHTEADTAGEAFFAGHD